MILICGGAGGRGGADVEVKFAPGYAREIVARAPQAALAVVRADAGEGFAHPSRCFVHLLGLLGVPTVLAAAAPGAAAEARAYAARLSLPGFECVPAGELDAFLDKAAPRAAPPPGPPSESADQFEATVIWLDGEPMLRGRSYGLRTAGAEAMATIAPLKYRLDPDTLEHIAAEALEIDQVGVCELELDRPVAFAAYRDDRRAGRFELVDRVSGRTVGEGLIHFALRRAANLTWQPFTLDRKARAAAKGQRACVLWLTGLSGAGKSTLANHLERALHAMGRHTYVLDGDNVRHGLSKDLGFTEADRVENIRRVAEVARLMVDAGLIVITAFISPFRSERRMARALFAEGEFYEVFVDAPLEVAERRDPKGLYRKARRGELANFTGIDSPYEPPERAELRIDTASVPPEEAAARVLAALREAGALGGRAPG